MSLSTEEQELILSSTARSVTEFITDFEHIVSGSLQRIEALPTTDEMKQLVKLDDEVMIIVGRDDRVFAIKGNKRRERDLTQLPHIALKKKRLLSLSPKIVVHTHIMGDKGKIALPGTKDYERTLFMESIPSIKDLTTPLGRKNVPVRYYVFSRFGRTTFQPIPNLGRDSEDPNGSSIVRRQLIKALRGQAVQEIIEKGITGGKDRLNTIGEFLGSSYGCGFKFELYEELGGKLYEL